MDTAVKPSLASKLHALADAGSHFASTPAEARATLDELRREYPELPRFLAQKFSRLPAAQQHMVLGLCEAAPGPEWTALLQQWSRDAAVPLPARVRALTLQERLAVPVDAAYRDTLAQAAQILQDLGTTEPAPLTEAGELETTWQDMVRQLPLALALDVAHELARARPAVALAVLRALRPALDDQGYLRWVESLATLPSPESATLLLEILAETTSKTLQKAIKKALHRLKVHGITFAEPQQQGHTAVVGTVAHRLERCRASYIDSAGDRIVLMIRTKPLGGYNLAYLILNYGLGIRYAMGLQATKRELPELLAKAQGNAPMIDLEPTYCQSQVALIQQMNLETGTPVPEEFFALRDVIGESQVTFEQALIYSALSADDLEAIPTYEERAAALLDLPEFAGWTLPASVIQRYGDALRDIEDSQIVVSPALRQERVNEVYAQAMAEALSEQTRRVMRLRLEEMAYYLWQTERQREALWAVAAAQSLQHDEPHRLRHNPFAGALLQRSLDSAKARPTSGRIILPFSQTPGSRDSSSSSPSLIV